MAAPRLDVTSTHRECGKDGKKTNVFRFYFCPLERSRISDVAWRTPVLVSIRCARTVSSFVIENSLLKGRSFGIESCFGCPTSDKIEN